MKILSIEAGRDAVRLRVDSDGVVLLRESVPTVGEKPGRALFVAPMEAKGGVIELSRVDSMRDRIFSRYDLFEAGEPVPGVHYITEVAADVPADASDYPQPDIIKTLGLPGDLAKQ